MPVEHVPVLVDRVVSLLAPVLERPGSVLVDATLGLGGHAHHVLARCPNAHLVGIDRDPHAVVRAERRLRPFGARVTLMSGGYDSIAGVLAGLGHRCVQAVLFDLGVSSMQLDDPGRGFAYAVEAPLDMRMDPQQGLTAADVLNTYPQHDLARILSWYGEERYASRIASAVVRARQSNPLATSSQLVAIVREAIPAPARRRGGHPAKRTFQALRIEVNDELGALRRALPEAIGAICLGGRIVVLAYHSLEDKVVKAELVRHTRSQVPPDLPVVPPGSEPELRSLTKGADLADATEVARNRRAQSVRLRAAERVRVAA